jgi:hypothetical protein
MPVGGRAHVPLRRAKVVAAILKTTLALRNSARYWLAQTLNH